MVACMERHPRRARWKRRWHRLRYDPWSIVMGMVGDHTVGGNSVPTNWRSEKRESVEDRIDGTLAVGSSDDAFGIYLRRYYKRSDSPEPEVAPVYELNRNEARWLAWYVLRWFAADWFGLRRRIYYHALHRHLGR